MKPGEALIEAARKQAEGEVAVHIANIKVYQTMPAGIGEHSDVTEAVIEELNKLACLLYTSPSPRDEKVSRMPSSA